MLLGCHRGLVVNVGAKGPSPGLGVDRLKTFDLGWEF